MQSYKLYIIPRLPSNLTKWKNDFSLMLRGAPEELHKFDFRELQCNYVKTVSFEIKHFKQLVKIVVHLISRKQKK